MKPFVPFASFRTALFAAASLLTFLVSPASAQDYYTGGHGDIGVGYTPGETEFEPHWHLGGGAIVNGSPLAAEAEYAPGDLIAWTTTTFAAPSGSGTWLGVTPGTSVFRMGTSTYQPNLGWATEEAGAETVWENGTINISLTGWSNANPGHFALVTGGTALFSTVGNAATTNNNSWNFDVEVGHAHATWYFSHAGYYELSFTWTGLYIGTDAPPEGIAVTGTGTFGFQGGAIPEPSSAAALAGLFALGAVALRRQRRA